MTEELIRAGTGATDCRQRFANRSELGTESIVAITLRYSLEDSDMAILVRCACGAKISAPAKYLGRVVPCPSCREGLEVKESASVTNPKDLIVFHCECGKKLKAKPKAAGRTTKCPKCNGAVTVPTPKQPDPPKPQPSVIEDPSSSSIFDDSAISMGSDISGLLDEIGAHECKTNRRCPNCKSDMKRDDVLCIECGYNSKTKKIMGAEKEKRGSAILSSVKNLFSE